MGLEKSFFYHVLCLTFGRVCSTIRSTYSVMSVTHVDGVPSAIVTSPHALRAGACQTGNAASGSDHSVFVSVFI